MRLATLRLLLFEPGTIISQHAEIVIRELEIIFRHHAVALHLGIARKILVFFQQLGGIATRPVVDTIALFRAVSTASATTLRTRPGAIATTIIILAIVDQRPTFQRTGYPARVSGMPGICRALAPA